MHKILLTDLGNVVVFFDRRRVAGGLLALAPAKTIDEIDDLINKSHAGISLLEQFETGVIQADAYQRGIEKLLDARILPDDFRRIHTDLFTPNMPVIDLWQQLLNAGAVQKIIAVSDTDPLRLKKMTCMSGLHFDGTVTSYAVGRKKPHRDVFRAALAIADTSPDACIFVDDNEHYVHAARALGMKGIHYRLGNPQAQEMLIMDLRESGVAI